MAHARGRVAGNELEEQAGWARASGEAPRRPVRPLGCGAWSWGGRDATHLYAPSDSFAELPCTSSAGGPDPAHCAGSLLHEPAVMGPRYCW